MKKEDNNSTEVKQDVKLPVRRCFILLEEEEPSKSGMYDVITNKGRVVNVYYEKFCGNHIWEVHWREHASNERVVAWSENIA